MFETLGLENWTPKEASVVVGLVLGLLFGIFAQRSKFCLRRGLVGDITERASALSTWLTALVVAILGTQGLSLLKLVDFSEHRFLTSEIPVAAIALGGLMFGAGMVLARGCASRLTVLGGSGNMRALVTILIFAAVAHATLKGVFAPVRVWISSLTTDLGSFASLPGHGLIWGGIGAIALALFVRARSVVTSDLIYGALIGSLVPLGYLATGLVLFDEFDPITLESIAFTSAGSESLFWGIAGTAIEPGFGVGLLGGVLAGSAIAALTFKEFKWVGFTSDLPTSNYLLGGSLMGMGGVLAGGCTVGAGLSGVALLSVGAILALVSIIAGALLTQALRTNPRLNGAAIPAE